MMSAPDSSTSPVPVVRRSRRWSATVALAGPAFALVVIVQAATRSGFSLAEQPLSLLALGPGGYIQTAAFFAAGALFTVGAIACERTMPSTARRSPARLVGLFGICLIVAGLFPADPAYGYPVGADDATTWTGAVHNAAAGIGGLALVVAAALASLQQRRAQQPRRAIVSGTVAAASLLIGAIGSATGAFHVAFASGAIAWIWASLYLAHELRSSGTTAEARLDLSNLSQDADR